MVSDFSLEIEWDPKKAEGNVGKHGVSFIVAATVLRDPLSVTVFDADRGGARAHARIISAREAKNSERQSYEEGQ